MEYKEILKEAILSLKKNVLRTSLTMLGIVIGISAVILIVSVGQGAVKFITNELTAFGVNFFSINPGSNAVAAFAGGQRTLTLEDARAIENDPTLTNVKSVIPFTSANTGVSANGIDKKLLIYGMNHKAVEFLNPTILSGEFLTEEHVRSSIKVAVIGVDAAEDFFGKDTDPVGEIIRVDNKPFRIVGVLQSSSGFFGGFFNNTVYIPIEISINQILGRDAGIQEMDISVYDTDLINQTMEDVRIVLRERHDLREGDEDDFIMQSFQDALSTVENITSLLTLLVAGVSGISLIVGGVGVMNIMLVSVTERTREIGLLKAIGAKQKDIMIQFLMESVVMTLVGGSIGIAIGILGSLAISVAVKIPFVVSIPAIIAAVGVSSAVGIVFGLYPAGRAAKLPPVDALRYE
jgi:putative ABC transport system permease protein